MKKKHKPYRIKFILEDGREVYCSKNKKFYDWDLDETFALDIKRFGFSQDLTIYGDKTIIKYFGGLVVGIKEFKVEDYDAVIDPKVIMR